MRLAAFLIVMMALSSCETSYNSTIRLRNGLLKNDIIVASYLLDSNWVVIGPHEIYLADKRHGINSSCGTQFHYGYMEGFRIDSVGKISGSDTIYSPINYNNAEEWENICRDGNSRILDDYFLSIEESDF